MAIVTTRGKKLNCFQTADKKSQVITSYLSGTRINITSTQIVNGIVWGRVDNVGWVVVNDPMISYSYVDLDESAEGDIINTEITIQNQQTSTVEDSSNGYTEQLTMGVVNLGNTMYYDVEINEEKLKMNEAVASTNNATAVSTNEKPIQNDYGYPYIKEFDIMKGMYQYDYYMDYSRDGLDSDMEKLRRSVNYDIMNRDVLTRKYMRNYNRFKTPSPNDAFVKGFPHIFITRPTCNILVHQGQGEYKLSDTCGSDNKYINGLKNNRNLLIELTGSTEYNHDFNMFLSNKAQSIEIKDTTIESDEYGKNLLGYQIAYAKHAAKSKARSEVSIKYTDDRDLNIIKLHDFWTDYIDKVYRGRFSPLSTDIYSKTLDYVCSIYYFLTAEDGETIIYWTKYIGAFPTNVPESVLDMQENAFVKTPEFNINYAYSFKSDPFDPKVIVDFNLNSNNTNTADFKYVKTYDRDRLGVGDTWVGAPFVELCPLQSGGFVYKLRFRRSPDLI